MDLLLSHYYDAGKIAAKRCNTYVIIKFMRIFDSIAGYTYYFRC